MLFYKIIYVIFMPLFRLVYRIRTTGREKLPEEAAVVCANHSSMLDPIFLCIACGLKTEWAFMAKAELMKVPVLNLILKALKVIPVNRGATDISTLRNAISALGEGKKVMIFPEGTRVRDGEESAGAKTGAAMIASRAKAMMVPVYISTKKRLFGKIDVIFGNPVSTDIEEKGQAKYKMLAGKVFDEIMSLGNGGGNSGGN